MNQADIKRARESVKGGVVTPPSCLKCGHMKTCAIFRAIKPLMDNWPDGDSPDDHKPLRPFEAETIAIVCIEYAENFIVIPRQEPE